LEKENEGTAESRWLRQEKIAERLAELGKQNGPISSLTQQEIYEIGDRLHTQLHNMNRMRKTKEQ